MASLFKEAVMAELCAGAPSASLGPGSSSDQGGAATPRAASASTTTERGANRKRKNVEPGEASEEQRVKDVAACLTKLQQLGGAIEDETVREQVASYLERVPNILNEYLQKLQRDKAEQHLHAIWECADTEYKLEVLRRLQASLPSERTGPVAAGASDVGAAASDDR